MTDNERLAAAGFDPYPNVRDANGRWVRAENNGGGYAGAWFALPDPAGGWRLERKTEAGPAVRYGTVYPDAGAVVAAVNAADPFPPYNPPARPYNPDLDPDVFGPLFVAAGWSPLDERDGYCWERGDYTADENTGETGDGRWYVYNPDGDVVAGPFDTPAALIAGFNPPA